MVAYRGDCVCVWQRGQDGARLGYAGALQAHAHSAGEGACSKQLQATGMWEGMQGDACWAGTVVLCLLSSNSTLEVIERCRY
jgi:hypothetical protein